MTNLKNLVNWRYQLPMIVFSIIANYCSFVNSLHNPGSTISLLTVFIGAHLYWGPRLGSNSIVSEALKTDFFTIVGTSLLAILVLTD